jgi:S-adenosylmethionine hydrolase
MIAFFTDFGCCGPYVGQMHAAVRGLFPTVPIVDLFHDSPPYDVRAAACLLAAYSSQMPRRSVICAVVDPGVGTARAAVIVEADGRLFVGPDNGLFTLIVRRASLSRAHEVLWQPAALSATFHGRDLFAPVAAMLARGEWPASRPTHLYVPKPDWPDNEARVLYVDRYGNGITGIRASSVTATQTLSVAGMLLPRAHTFADVARLTPFWYENANGLAEIAVREGSAAVRLPLQVGDEVLLQSADSAGV